MFPVNGMMCIKCNSGKFCQNGWMYNSMGHGNAARNGICILKNKQQTKRALTLSTMKSMASAILESTGPLAKFPRTIFFSMKAGINQKLRGHGRKSKRSDCSEPLFHSTAFYPSLYVPVCSPGLVEDSGVAEGVAQHEWVNPGRLVCVLSKLLRQESTQRGSEQMDLKIKDTTYLFWLIRVGVSYWPFREAWCGWWRQSFTQSLSFRFQQFPVLLSWNGS